MKKKVIFIILFAVLFLGIIIISNRTSSTDKSYSNNKNNALNDENLKGIINKNAKLEDITKEEGKVNIYFFWGNGCPHCREELEWFESIKKEYGDIFKLYGFEVWYDEYNSNLLNTFANAINEKVDGVPFTIIGKEKYIGFGGESKKVMLNAIKEYKDKSFDVYIDKIKNNE